MKPNEANHSVATQVLWIPELLEQVAQNATIPAMFSLSLTCIRFRDVALAALWENLLTPFFLLKLFSSFKWRASKKIWTVGRRPQFTTYELQRFHRYASLVRRLSYPLSSAPGGLPDIDPDIYIRLSEASSMAPLFPMLRKCCFEMASIGSDVGLRSIAPFFTIELKKLSLRIPRKAGYIEELKTLPPSIRRLHLSGFFSFESLGPIDRFKHLVDLSLLSYRKDQTISLGTLLSILPSLSALRRLALKVHPDCALPVLPKDVITTVTSISLEGLSSHISQIIGLFCNLEVICFRIISAHDIDQHPAAILCFQHIANMSVTTLKSIQIDTGYFGNVGTFRLFPLRSIIKPLLLIGGIEHFVYSHSSVHCSGLHDDDIRDIARAWPRLQQFKLPFPSRHISPPVPSALTFRSLRYLAQLRRLEVLAVTVAYSEVRLPLYVPFHESEPNVQSYARSIFDHYQPRNNLSRSLSNSATSTLSAGSNFTFNKAFAAASLSRELELIEKIIADVAPSDLWNLTRVCKSFHAAAIKRLWKVIPSVVPLLKLLPGSLLIKNGRYCQWEPPVDKRTETFASFDQHASLVKVVLTDLFSSEPKESSEYKVDAEIFTRLCHHRPGRILFSSLHSFKYSLYGKNLPPIIPFLSPVLQVIDLHQMPSNVNHQLLSDILDHSPNIIHLTLRGVVSPTMLLPLRHFRVLKSLSILFSEDDATARGSFIFALDAIPYLQYLESLAYNIPDGVVFPIRSRRTYATIRRLSLQGQSAAIAIQLSIFFGLEQVSLDFTDTDDANNKIRICCEHLQHGSGTSLHSLIFKCDMPLSISTSISPLFQLHTIRCLAIDDRSRRVIPLTENDVQQMVEAWPLLEQLIVRGDRQPLRSLKRLSYLARLPYLRYLCLPTGVIMPFDPFEYACSNSPEVSMAHQFFSPQQMFGVLED